MAKKTQSLLEKCYKDSNGKVILGQFPNPPLVTWVAATVVAKIITDSDLVSLLEVVAFGAIFTWAWLELFQGVTYFRRCLGLLVLLFSVYNQL